MDRSQATKVLCEQRARQTEVVREYITEAEHMEGDDYWERFEGEEELLADFDLYIENRG